MPMNGGRNEKVCYFEHSDYAFLLPVASALGCQQQTGTAVEHYERGVALYEDRSL